MPFELGCHDKCSQQHPHCKGPDAPLVNEIHGLLPFKVCLCGLSKRKCTKREKVIPRHEKYHELPASAPTHKELASCHSQPTPTTELNKLKINDFSWTHQRPELARQTAPWDSRKTGAPRDTAELHSPKAEAAGATARRKSKVLIFMNHQRKHMNWMRGRKPRGLRACGRGWLHVMSFVFRNSTRFHL